MRCEMSHSCVNPVTHLGDKGVVYRTPCATIRKGWE